MTRFAEIIERERERDRQTDRQTQTDRQRETERERKTERERQREILVQIRVETILITDTIF